MSFIAEQELLKSVRAAIKGSDWKLRGHSTFCEFDDYFARCPIDVIQKQVRSAFDVKPMEVDNIFWDIMNMSENRLQPLSFRSNAAFKCAPVPVFSQEFDSIDKPPDELAREIFAWQQLARKKFTAEFGDRNFSEIVGESENYVARGAYAVTLILSLHLEGQIDKARIVCGDIVEGRKISVEDYVDRGRSIYELYMDFTNYDVR